MNLTKKKEIADDIKKHSIWLDSEFSIGRRQNHKKRRIASVDFSRTNISEGYLIACNFENCNFIETRMIGTVFSYSEFKNCRIVCSDMTGAYFLECIFQNCQILEGNLTRAYLIGAHFKAVELSGSIFKSANLRNAVFKGFIKGQGDFRDALINKRTKFCDQ